MDPIDIVRAWKDPAYAESLSAEQRAALPPHPVGSPTIDDLSLTEVSGAGWTDSCTMNSCVTRVADGCYTEVGAGTTLECHCAEPSPTTGSICTTTSLCTLSGSCSTFDPCG